MQDISDVSFWSDSSNEISISDIVAAIGATSHSHRGQYPSTLSLALTLVTVCIARAAVTNDGLDDGTMLGVLHLATVSKLKNGCMDEESRETRERERMFIL